MEYPLFIHGKRAGSLSITQDGLYTRIKAHAPGLEEGLYRISLFGEGESSYLGLMEPGEDGMYLERRLTRQERTKLPRKIEYAGDTNGLHNIISEEDSAKNKRESDKKSLHNYGKDPSTGRGRTAGEGEGERPVWQRCSDGSLVSFTRSGALLALPVKLKRPAAGARIELIDGAEYMVFRY